VPWKDNNIRLVTGITAYLNNIVNISLPTIPFTLLIQQRHIWGKQNYGTSRIVELISICCSYLPELICQRRFKQDGHFEWMFHDVEFWSSGLKCILYGIALHIPTSSVAYIFFGSCMFFISNHGVLEIRWQMTEQVPYCITEILACIVFVTLQLYFP
jgi:hypothetical protein